MTNDDEEENLLFLGGGIDVSYNYQKTVKWLNLSSVDYSIEDGTSMEESRAYCGAVAV